jgi:hypothetical protein
MDGGGQGVGVGVEDDQRLTHLQSLFWLQVQHCQSIVLLAANLRIYH